METTQDIFNEIKEYSYSKFKGVFSRPYFNHVLMNLYKNPKEKDFSLIYGDFNQLNDINLSYTENFGDILMENTYQKIQSILSDYFPENTFNISRMGGDEFAILIDTQDSSNVKNVLDDIASTLNKGSLSSLKNTGKKPEFLSFSYGIVNSKEPGFSDIYKMYHEAEKREASFKLYNGIDSSDFYTTLNVKLKNSFHNFIKNFRFSDSFKFDLKNQKGRQLVTKDVRKLMLASIDSTSQLLSNPNKIKELVSKLNEFDTPMPIKDSNILNDNQCMQIHSLLTDSSFCINPDDFKKDDLSCFLNELIREPVSGFYSGNYFSSYFYPNYMKSNTTFSTAALVDIMRMKDSNLKDGHLKTDEKMNSFSRHLYEGIQSTFHPDFSKDNFDFSQEKSYAFDFKGGKYLFLTNESLSLDKFNELIDSSMQSCEPLTPIFSLKNINGQKNLVPIIKDLMHSCESKKKKFRQDLDFSDDLTLETLELFLSSSLNYYLENCPNDPCDINEQKKLFESIAYSIAEEASRSSKEHEKYNKAKQKELR